MAEIDIDTALDWRGRTVVDRNGEKIGKFQDVYLDEGTDRPAWAAVTTGLFGLRQSFVPLSAAERVGDQVQVPFEKALVANAPNTDPDVALSPEEEERLYRHYGQDHQSDTADGDERDPDQDTSQSPRGEARGSDASSPSDEEAAPIRRGAVAAEPESGSDEHPAPVPDRHPSDRSEATDDAMTRSEEEVRVVGHTKRPTHRVRLKKYVVTDHVKKTVPVKREKIELQREPVDDDDPA